MRRFIVFVLVLVALVPATVLAQDAATRGQNLLEEGNYRAAILAFTEVLTADPQNVDALIGRAQAKIELLRAESALNDAVMAVELAPDNPAAYAARGLALATTGEADSALADFDQAVALDATFAEGYYLRAEVHLALGNIESALDDYNAAVDLNPDEATYLFSRGRAYYVSLGEFDRALTDFDRAIDLAPERSEYYLSRARLHADMGNLDAAISDYDVIIDMTPDVAPTVYLSRGFYHAEAGAIQSAANDYYEWITRNENRRFEQNTITNNGRRQLDMEEGYTYVIPFDAEEPTRISVAAFSPDGMVDPVLVVLDETGNPIYVDDDGGRGLASRINEYVLPELGTYTLIVSHAGGGSVGNVVVRFRSEVYYGDV